MRFTPASKVLLGLLIATLVANVLGIPGLAVETRELEQFAAWASVPAVATLVLPVLAALALPWAPRPGAWLAIAAGALGILFYGADLLGLTSDVRPSMAVMALDVVYVALSVGVLVYARKALAEGASPVGGPR